MGRAVSFSVCGVSGSDGRSRGIGPNRGFGGRGRSSTVSTVSCYLRQAVTNWCRSRLMSARISCPISGVRDHGAKTVGG